MTKEEKIRQRDAEIDQIIDRFDMTEKCGLTREQIHQRVIKGMVSTNMAHVMADAANSLLLDAEDVLKPMQVCFSREDKYHYKQMLDHITAAKKWAAKSAFEPYQTKEADLFAQDSDWWYNIIRLIEDRTGDNVMKTKQVLQWLITMPSEMNLFKIKMSDFKRSLYDIPNEDRQGATETSD